MNNLLVQGHILSLQQQTGLECQVLESLYLSNQYPSHNTFHVIEGIKNIHTCHEVLKHITNKA